MEWSEYQRAIFHEAARDTQENCAVVARAGSGKTTSLLEALNHVPYRRTLLCAFNKSIQLELERRAPRNVTTRTLHALGLRVHQLNLQSATGRAAQVDSNKARSQVSALLKERPGYWRRSQYDTDWTRMNEIATAVRNTASFAKNVLAGRERLVDIAAEQDLDNRDDATRVAEAAHCLMERSAADPHTVDFDDMVWMPYRYGYGVEPETEMIRFDAVLVDEVQDVNAAQLWLIERIQYGGRVIGLGDPRQAIYAFRGADRGAIASIGGKHLSLPISYRCPRTVVELARQVVPDIEPAPDAPDGSVTLHQYDEMIDQAAPGDFILSRANAPLMTTCLQLLRLGRPATIAGRDLGQSLRRLVDKAKPSDIPGLTRWLHEWLVKEHARHMPEHPDRYERSRDRVACLFALLPAAGTVQDLRRRLDELFTDRDDCNAIVCSTVHKAKGLERDRVWMLSDTFGYPQPKPWQDRWSEENIWYVAVTRAKDRLCFVDTPIKDIMPSQGGGGAKRKRQVKWR